jgi:hypothetical protein
MHKMYSLLMFLALVITACDNDGTVTTSEIVFESDGTKASPKDLIYTTDNKILLLTQEGEAPYTSKLYKLNLDYSEEWNLSLDQLFAELQERPDGGYLLSGGSRVASVNTDGNGLAYMHDFGMTNIKAFEQEDGKIFGCGNFSGNQQIVQWENFSSTVANFAINSEVIDFVLSGHASGETYGGINDTGSKLVVINTSSNDVPLSDVSTDFETVDINTDGFANYYILGNVNSGTCDVRMQLSKYNSFGTKEWSRILGNSESENFVGSVTVAGDRLYVSGYYGESTCTLNASHTQFYAAELTTSGKMNFQLKTGEAGVSEGIQKVIVAGDKIIGAGVKSTGLESRVVLLEIASQ